MIDPRLVPSSLVSPASRQVVIRLEEDRRRGLWALTWSARWAASLVLALLTRRLSPEAAGMRGRAFAEHYGGLWVKLGQLLSLRIDLFGTAFCAELGRLQDVGTGFPGATAIAIVERELGAPIEERFAWFDPNPIAAASIGQVHRARLRNGRAVAVKVRRPDIVDQVEGQLGVIDRLTRLAARLGVLPQVAWRQFSYEIREVMREELDYRYEAANTTRMRSTLRRHGIHVPLVYDSYSTACVLTTEFIDGVSMVEYIQAAGADPDGSRRWLADNGIDPRRVARTLSLSLLRQILEDNLFHGDLHPGNIMLLRDGHVGLIDFGTVSSTEREYLEKFRMLSVGLTTRDFLKVAQVTLLMCSSVPPIDLQPVIDELVQVVQAWTARTFVPTLSYHQKSLVGIYGEVTKVLIRNGCGLEWGILRIRRAQETLDASLLVLIPDANPTKISEDYFLAARRRSAQGATNQDVHRRLVAVLLDVEQVVNSLAETTLLQFELILRRAQVFTAHSSRVVSAATTVVGGLAGSGAVMCAAFLAVWLMPNLLGDRGGSTLAGLDVHVRLIVLAAAVSCTASFGRLWVRLRQPAVAAIDAVNI
jgi:ubiquinone biosynthesis protein